VSSIVRIEGSRIALRDPRPEDVEARLRWSTVETEWQNWDAPWEGVGITPPDRLDRARGRLLAQIAEPRPTPRTQLWIERIGGPLLGWANHYHYDPTARVTWVGISICESAYWAQGIGTEALLLWIDYLVHELGLTSVRTATWSGNTRMIRCAEKCGFVPDVVNRGKREVRGKRYDGIEFSLPRETWLDRRSTGR